MKTIKTLCMFIGIVLLFGCTDTQMQSLMSYGSEAHITCYSGERVIYDGRSTGKVSSAQGSDGYLFKDAATGKLKIEAKPA